MRRSIRQRGVALVIVMWVLSLMTIMAGSFSLSMRRETAVTSAVKDSAVAQAMAEAGIAIAEFMLLAPDESKRWRGDGRIYQIHYLDADIRIRIFSEAGKIDLNQADRKLLSAAVNTVVNDANQQQQLVDAILDWRDDNDEPRPLGAEREYYRSAGLPYRPRNGAFQSLEELQQVRGIEPALFEALKPLLTVYSGLAEVDLQVAPPEVLDVVADYADRDEVAKQLAARQVNRSRQGVAGGLTAEETEPLADLTDTAYSLIAEVRIGDEASTAIAVTIKPQSDDETKPPFQLLDWQLAQVSPSLFADEMDPLLVTAIDEFKYQH